MKAINIDLPKDNKKVLGLRILVKRPENLFLDLNKKEYKEFKKIDLIEKLKYFSKKIDKKILQNEKNRNRIRRKVL